MNSVIGVFDSGVGGLTVFRELKLQIPEAKLIYLGDTARTPYGSKGSETVKRYASECAAFLLSRGITELVVACNTVSSHALEELKHQCGALPVYGTIDPAVEAASAVSRGGSVLVIGTSATVRSGAYERALKRHGISHVFQKACPLFVPLVEESLHDGTLVEQAIELYLGQFRAPYLDGPPVDTVILGCTHYPLLRGALQLFFGPEVSLVDCASTLAKRVKRAQVASDTEAQILHLSREDEFFATDDPLAFSSLAQRILGRSVVATEGVLEIAA